MQHRNGQTTLWRGTSEQASMKLAGAALIVVIAGLGLAPSLLAQDGGRPGGRITAALQRPSHLGSSVPTWTEPPSKKLGIFTLVPATQPGEMVRLRLPIGE